MLLPPPSWHVPLRSRNPQLLTCLPRRSRYYSFILRSSLHSCRCQRRLVFLITTCSSSTDPVRSSGTLICSAKSADSYIRCYMGSEDECGRGPYSCEFRMACSWPVDPDSDLASVVASVVRWLCCRLLGRHISFERSAFYQCTRILCRQRAKFYRSPICCLGTDILWILCFLLNHEDSLRLLSPFSATALEALDVAKVRKSLGKGTVAACRFCLISRKSSSIYPTARSS